MNLRVSPSEPTTLRAIGTTDMLPERFGADVLWPAPRLGLVGVQRKLFPGDFLSSVTDGRLAQQVAQMQRLAVRVLLLEGRGKWSTEGELIVPYGQPWSRSQHRRFLWSMRLRGVWVDWSDSLADTVGFVADLHEWTMKERHDSLNGRPKPTGRWGRPTDRDWSSHLLQSFPGIGSEMAGRIIDRFGRAPLAWTVTPEEMGMVQGVGDKKIEAMFRALEGEVERD